MSNLAFSLNATMPLFLVVAIGYLLRRIGVIDEIFASKMNHFVYWIAIPVMLFRQMATADFRTFWDTGFFLFTFICTLLCVGVGWFIARYLDPKEDRAEFIQATYRSSVVILGAACMTNVYGNVDTLPLLLLACVPANNVVSAVILEVMGPGKDPEPASSGNASSGRFAMTKKTLLALAKNPVLISILAGTVWSLIRIPVPQIMNSTLNLIGSLVSPMGLIAMGAGIRPEGIKGEFMPATVASAVKLVLLCILFVPLAALFGFRGPKLLAILIMLGSPATINCYTMARAMGHKGDLSANAVALSTLLVAFTMTFWIFLLRTAGWL